MSIIERIRAKWQQSRIEKQQQREVQDRINAASQQLAASPEIKIQTPWGNVTESARRQAAMNMAADPKKKAEVEVALARKLGSVAAGLAEAQRCYPEAYRDVEVAR